MISSLQATEPPRVIAHRGNSSAAPENTLSAIRSAVEVGADWIEFDVRPTADGTLVLLHDKTLKRCSGANLEITALTAEELAKHEAGAFFAPEFKGEPIPTLAQALEACGDCLPLIERKAGTPESYLRVIRDLGLVDRVIVQSFDWEFLAGLRKLEPNLRLGMLGDKKLSEDKLRTILQFQPDWVGWDHRHTTEERVRQLQDAGIRVAVWTVNDIERAATFADWGVDGIITDIPEFVREHLEAEPEPKPETAE